MKIGTKGVKEKVKGRSTDSSKQSNRFFFTFKYFNRFNVSSEDDVINRNICIYMFKFSVREMIPSPSFFYSLSRTTKHI
jgi:hypothetical protein